MWKTTSSCKKYPYIINNRLNNKETLKYKSRCRYCVDSCNAYKILNCFYVYLSLISCFYESSDFQHLLKIYRKTCSFERKRCKMLCRFQKNSLSSTYLKDQCSQLCTIINKYSDYCSSHLVLWQKMYICYLFLISHFLWHHLFLFLVLDTLIG